MPDNSSDLISVKAAARQCGRNPETVRRWIWNGRLPAEKLGNQLFIKKDDLESYCRETAVLEYQAGPTSTSGSSTGKKQEKQMQKAETSSWDEREVVSSSRSAVIERLRQLRQQIHNRMGRDFSEAEFEEMLDMMHEYSSEEISGLH